MQGQPKIGKLIPHIWLSKVLFTESRLLTRKLWVYNSRGSPGQELSTAQRLQVLSCSFSRYSGLLYKHHIPC